MIAKISATENLGGALGYNFKKVNKKEATLLLAHGLYQNRAGEYTMSEVLADMQALIPETVSYTHLDVYKRQPPSCSARCITSSFSRSSVV